MYQLFKKVLKLLIPRRVMFRMEPLFRNVLYVFYRGRNYQCNICGKALARFIMLPTGDRSCPCCGSLGRNRRLYRLLQSEDLSAKLMLEFSPSRSMYRKLKERSGGRYTTTDYAGEFIADKKLDITAMDEPSGKYDMIICYHILEHIEDDRKAIAELYRVLKKGGKVFIQTPFKEGDIYENFEIKDPAGRELHFGQADHVRVYSVEGLKKRLEAGGFNVQLLEFHEKENNHHGFNTNEYVLLALK